MDKSKYRQGCVAQPLWVRILRTVVLIVALALAACGGPDVSVQPVSTAQLRQGDSAPPPPADTALILTGLIGVTNVDNELHLDIELLEQLGVHQYSVTDLWLDTQVLYSGVLVRDLLEFADVSAQASQIEVQALDGYRAEISFETLREWPIIVATRTNGEPMSIAEGGPTRIIFPYDQYPDTANAKLQSVWNIESIEIR